MWSRLAFVGAFILLVADGAAALAADPPGRVGRVSYVDGTVSMRADMGEDSQDPEWRAATVNYPVTTGNSLWTENGGKAEVQVGPAEVRLDQQTELEVLRLDDNAVDLALHQGTVNVHLGSELPGGLRIDTPRGPVRLTRPGSYRVGVDTSGENANDAVELVAFDGEAEIEAISDNRRDTHRVGRGQSVRIAGDVVLGDARVTPFDQWAKSRDPGVVMPQQAQNAPMGGTIRPVQQTTQYVSPQATGYQDLAGYGTWEQTPNYGAVWYPTVVVADWQPYRYGHWEYIRPWGWTWIDDAPWGFTPFHYGRWVRVGPRWAWWPGVRTVRPVYAPALVAFVGGNGWSVSITSGRARPVGWVPLAPYEVYRPHYRTSATYVRNVNVTTVNKTVINNITVNKNVEINKMVNRNAATVVSADSFRRGQKVNEAKIDVSRKDFDKARVSNDVRRIAPERVAARAEAPRPAARKDDNIRRPDPGMVSREQQQRGPQRVEQSRQREQAQQAERQQREQQQERQKREQAEQNQRRERDAQERQRREQVQQQERQQREQAQERQRRDQAEQEQQRRQRDAQDQQRRQQAEREQQQRQREVQDQHRREQARDQQRREEQRKGRDNSDQRSEQIQPQQQLREQAEQQRAQQQIAEQKQRREAQQRQQAEQQQRADEQVRQQQQREAQERQQREVQRREAQDRQARDERQRDLAREQQRQQQHAQEQQRREQAMREQRQREVAQEQQQREQQRQQLRQREQAEQQQRQAQEQQRRQQAEQQQRQAQEVQQRQQREQAQERQQRQQQEQAREEQRRKGQERREDRRERAG